LHTAKIFVAGHLGMVGSAILRTLLQQGVPQANIITSTRSELDECNQATVNIFFIAKQPAQLYLASATRRSELLHIYDMARTSILGMNQPNDKYIAITAPKCGSVIAC
jgi:dTDP-4-dehydrorhamnose reductase